MTSRSPENAVGRYRLLDVAGEGASAVVWRGDDALLHRAVAVKILRPGIAADGALVERFFTEARAMAGLSDPAIVQIYDMIADGERHALVMEYIDGPSLAHILKRESPLPPARAVAIARDVARALGAAHARGILHRDIKPGNILTTRAGAAKVADFGLAKALEEPDGGATMAGGLVGSAHYLSPEQAQGLPLTPASDLYSLGVVLHHMLAGRLPFAGDSAIAMAVAHVSEPVPDEAVLARSMSPELATIVHRLLAKDPAVRFASAADVEAALAAAHVAAATAAPEWDAPTVVSAAAAAPPPRPQRPVVGAQPRRLVPLFVAAFVAVAALEIVTAARTHHAVSVAPRAIVAAPKPAPFGVVIPKLYGLPAARAAAALDARALKVRFTSRPALAPQNAVITQTPAAGARVRRGAAVTVTLSEGPP
jgi:serine/threonine-protein kinase